MARIRRTAPQAREEILNAAQSLLAQGGPRAITLKAVAARVGVSHPAVLHHFGTMDGVLEALHHRVSSRIRADLLAVLGLGPGKRRAAISSALAQLADPEKGRMLAWLVATGRAPFPPAQEQGLAAVAARLRPDDASVEVKMRIQLAVLAMIGEALVGDAVRERLGMGEGQGAAEFREWLLCRLLSES